MFSSIKNFFKRRTSKLIENNRSAPPSILCGFVGLFEYILFWKKIWLSLCFMLILNIIFIICIQRQIKLFVFVLSLAITIMIIDAFESWLKHKHRTTLLRHIGSHDGQQLKTAMSQLTQWFQTQYTDFVYLRETNHTKAFILVNMYLGVTFITGKYINGYILIYVITMFLCVAYKVVVPILKMCKNMQQDLESECEYEGLIPEISDLEKKLLSIEPEHNQNMDDKQSYDYWKPDDIPFEEGSDSSENSSSLVTSFSMDKIQTLEKDVQSSDSSEDEYIPLGAANGLGPRAARTTNPPLPVTSAIMFTYVPNIFCGLCHITYI
ncbi:hypothetical protein O3G_MSEX010291 [Manduca sexta]|uniref:Uncharacterized protein n=1 Tax=Manduca sexta TaxID=7130 RepID=A0A922CTK2_MANSE|nr:hypothetical protein O3G_MSEX010291 [Manduca sexta]